MVWVAQITGKVPRVEDTKTEFLVEVGGEEEREIVLTCDGLEVRGSQLHISLANRKMGYEEAYKWVMGRLQVREEMDSSISSLGENIWSVVQTKDPGAPSPTQGREESRKSWGSGPGSVRSSEGRDRDRSKSPGRWQGRGGWGKGRQRDKSPKPDQRSNQPRPPAGRSRSPPIAPETPPTTSNNVVHASSSSSSSAVAKPKPKPAPAPVDRAESSGPGDSTRSGPVLRECYGCKACNRDCHHDYRNCVFNQELLRLKRKHKQASAPPNPSDRGDRASPQQ